MQLNTQDGSQPPLLERHLARLLIVLHYCGAADSNLIEGETRKIDSITRLQQFDFWVREPGHLALALLRSYLSTPDRFMNAKPDLRTSLDRILKDDQADVRRVKPLDGSPYSVYDDLDYTLSHLTARALVMDRPSFARSRQFSHQIILETSGIEIVKKILDGAPHFAWYRDQCELVAAYFNRLERYDLAVMTYLAPELNPTIASTSPLLPYIRRRYESAFGGPPPHADV